jgi:hypothetical protein
MMLWCSLAARAQHGLYLQSRVGVVRFGDSALVTLPLNSTKNSTEFASAVRNIPYDGMPNPFRLIGLMYTLDIDSELCRRLHKHMDGCQSRSQ